MPTPAEATPPMTPGSSSGWGDTCRSSTAIPARSRSPRHSISPSQLLCCRMARMPNSPQPRSGRVSLATPLPRIGIGVDVHAFAEDDRALCLAGLTWPGERGLAGHSDGDVAAHAACDALFSAAGLGDLGTQFGTDRPELANASGVTLLSQAARIVAGAGFVIGNIAIQII